MSATQFQVIITKINAMRSLYGLCVFVVLSFASQCGALSIPGAESGRRSFFAQSAGAIATVVGVSTTTVAPASAGPQIYSTNSGVKYAILKEPKDPKKAVAPAPGDIVAIEYTGYLSDGRIFDATHQEGKQNALLFKFGSDTVIKGLTDVINEMVVGQKIQAIIPPSMAFGDKGICLESGECLVKPGATLVYDVYLKKSSIPPP